MYSFAIHDYAKSLSNRIKESKEEKERKTRRDEYLKRIKKLKEEHLECMRKQNEEFEAKPRQFLYTYDPIVVHSDLFPNTLIVYSEQKGRFIIDNITNFNHKLYKKKLENLRDHPNGDKILLNLLKLYCSLVVNCFYHDKLFPRKVESDCLILKFLIKEIKKILPPSQSYDDPIVDEVMRLMVNDKINEKNYTLDGFIKRDKVPSQMIESSNGPTILKSTSEEDDGYKHGYLIVDENRDKYDYETGFRNTMKIFLGKKGGKTKRRKTRKRKTKNFDFRK